MVLPEENKNLEKLLNEPIKKLKGIVQYAGFCTVFNRKKNKPMFTFDTLSGFTEEHGKAIAIMQGALGSVDEKLFKIFKEFVNQTGELNDEAKKLVEKFDKKFRVLVSEK